MSSVTKTVVPYTAQRVTISSKKSIKDVLNALDAEVNKEKAGVNMMMMLANAKTKEDIDMGMKQLTEGKRDFVYVHTSTVLLYLRPRKRLSDA